MTLFLSNECFTADTLKGLMLQLLNPKSLSKSETEKWEARIMQTCHTYERYRRLVCGLTPEDEVSSSYELHLKRLSKFRY